MTCSACAAENRVGARFCNECGSPFATGCPSCGAEQRPGARFCDACGFALAEPGAVAPAEQVSAAVEAHGTGELRVVSVLFVDLVGYTSLSESRDAEEVRELLSRYFDTARTIVGRYGGVVEKFIGDAVMAVWGTPVAREDDCERAVRAGLDLVDAVAAFGREVGAPELRARAGVATGQAAAFATPGEGLVVGDRVNTASRVQSTAVPGTVYVDDTTRSASSAAIAYEDTGEHTVKGKAEPLRLWRAVRVVAGVGGALREEGLQAPFVGRDGDLRMLKDLFHQAADRGSARLVTISGPAGIGKSRLLREFGHYVDGLSEDVLWHSGRCLAYGEGVAFWALGHMVRQRLGILEEDAPDDAARKLAAGLERWIVDPDERAHVAPRLGALLGTAQPGLERQDLFSGWRLFFERLAAHAPVVLAFEDLQWADEGLLEFVAHLLEWSGGLPIFVLALGRPEINDRDAEWPPRRPGVTSVFVEPLRPDELAAVLDELVDGLPGDVREKIVAQAEGVPLYALETVRALVDRGALAHRDGRLAVVGELGELTVPATLSSLLTARLDALEPGERTLAKEVAVLGGAFPRAAAAALTSLDPGSVDGCLDALVRKQVLVVHGDPLSPDRGQYAFAQTLLRNVAYELLSRRERRPLHVAAAAQLREAFPNDGEEVAEVIAAHELDAYRAAVGDPDADELRDRAVASLRRAAARAEAVGAQEAAERAYRSALELVPRWDERAALTEAAAEAAYIAGRFAAAIELLEATTHEHEQAGRSRDAARLTAGIGRALTRMGQNAAALERMRSAIDVLGEDTVEPAVAQLNSQIANALVWSGAPQEALPVIERALDMSSALALPSVLFDALNSKAACYALIGRTDEALVLYHGMVAHAARHGLVRARGIAEANVGDCLLRAGLPGAEPHIEAGIAICRQLGDRKGAELGAGNLMLAHILSGRWDEARGLAAAAQGAGGDAEPYLAASLAVLHVLRGQHDEAREAASALAPWHDSDSTENRLLAVVLDALVEHAARSSPETLGRLLTGVRDAYDTEGIGSDAFRLGWPAGLSGALALGRLDDADMLVELLEAAPPGAIGAFLRAQRVRGRALVAAARGEHEGVEPGVRDAIGQFRAIGYLPSVATTQLDLAALLLDRDEQREALTLLDEAAEVLERLGAAPELERVAALRARTLTTDTVA